MYGYGLHVIAIMKIHDGIAKQYEYEKFKAHVMFNSPVDVNQYV